MKTTEARVTLGARIREHREAAKLTLDELGAKLRSAGLASGTSRQHLSAVERGETWPSPELVAALDAELATHCELIHILRDAKVKVAPRSSSADETIGVTAHLFFPLFISDLPDAGLAQQGTPYDFVPRGGSLHIGSNAMLHCFPFQVVVLHEEHKLTAGALPEIAIWRRAQIARSASAVEGHLAKLSPDVESLDHEPYCLSVFVVTDAPWTEARLRSRANQLLAMPSVLAAEFDSEESAEDRAAILLNSPEVICDVTDFSLTNSHFGAASWAGVSLSPVSENADATVRALIEFELQLQAFWCYASNVAAGADYLCPAYGEQFLRHVLSKLQRPWPTEHTAVRRLRETLVSTSRIVDLVNSALQVASV